MSKHAAPPRSCHSTRGARRHRRHIRPPSLGTRRAIVKVESCQFRGYIHVDKIGSGSWCPVVVGPVTCMAVRRGRRGGSERRSVLPLFLGTPFPGHPQTQPSTKRQGNPKCLEYFVKIENVCLLYFRTWAARKGTVFLSVLPWPTGRFRTVTAAQRLHNPAPHLLPPSDSSAASSQELAC